MRDRKYVTLELEAQDGLYRCDTLLRAMRVIGGLIIEDFTTVNLSEIEGEKTLYVTHKGLINSKDFSDFFKKKPFSWKNKKDFSGKLRELLNNIIMPFCYEGIDGRSKIYAESIHSSLYEVTMVLVFDSIHQEDAAQIMSFLSEGGASQDLTFAATSWFD